MFMKTNTRGQMVVVLLTISIFMLTFNQAFAKKNKDLEILSRSAKAFTSVVKEAKPAVVHVEVEKTVTANNYGQNHEFFNNPFFERKRFYL